MPARPLMLRFSRKRLGITASLFEGPAESLTLEDFHARPAFRGTRTRDAVDTPNGGDDIIASDAALKTRITKVEYETTDDE